MTSVISACKSLEIIIIIIGSLPLVTGILWASEPYCRWLRDFCLSALNKSSLATMSMESKIQEEVEHYIRYYIEPCVNGPINIASTLPHATFNVITQLITSTRLDYNHQDFLSIFEAAQLDPNLTERRSSILQNTPFSYYLVCPYLKHLNTFSGKRARAFLHQQLSIHRNTEDSSKFSDVMGLYIAKQFFLHKEGLANAPRHCFTGKRKFKAIT